MNTTNHLSDDDLALFALQLLPEGEVPAALEHIRSCAACRRKVAEFQGDLALLAFTSEMLEVPAAARELLLSSVAQEKRLAPGEEPAQPFVSGSSSAASPSGRGADLLAMTPRLGNSRARANALAWTGWAVAAGCAVAAGLQFHERHLLQDSLASEEARIASIQQSASASQVALSALSDPSALNVVLHQPSAHGAEAPRLPEGHAAYLPDRGALIFVSSNMEPLQPYKVYELWLLPAEKGQAPIPAASFRPDAAGNANVILPTGPKFASVKGFGVTIENDNTPPKQPTLPILLVGTSKT